MLVLTRKVGESILIGSNDIVITVVDVGRGRVRIGIKAPREVKILRSELREAETNKGVDHVTQQQPQASEDQPPSYPGVAGT